MFRLPGRRHSIAVGGQTLFSSCTKNPSPVPSPRNNVNRRKSIQVICLAMSLEIRPLAALYPPSHNFVLDWHNIKGRKCRRHEHTASGDHWDRSPIKHFFCMGSGGITLPRVKFDGRLPFGCGCSAKEKFNQVFVAIGKKNLLYH